MSGAGTVTLRGVGKVQSKLPIDLGVMHSSNGSDQLWLSGRQASRRKARPVNGLITTRICSSGHPVLLEYFALFISNCAYLKRHFKLQ